MRKYDCNFDEYGREFLDSIVDKMIELFGVSEDEAVGRINRQWAGQEFFDIDREDKEYNIAFHEDDYYWANTIYFGKESRWWHREVKEITPIPYP